jgi:hypothetical protein
MLKGLKKKNRRHFLDDGLEVTILVAHFVIMSFLPNRIVGAFCRLLFNLETAKKVSCLKFS